MTENQETTSSLAIFGMARQLCSDMAILPSDKDASCTAMLWAALELQVGGPDKLAKLINQDVSASPNPKKYGVYEVQIANKVGYALWDGSQWMCFRYSYHEAINQTIASKKQNWTWHELTEPAPHPFVGADVVARWIEDSENIIINKDIRRWLSWKAPQD